MVARKRLFEREPTRLFEYAPGARWRVIRDVEPGSEITASDVRAIPDVEAGNGILLLVRAGASTVSVEGRARRSGNVGEEILVHNPVTGALVRAIVLDERSAELVRPRPRHKEE